MGPNTDCCAWEFIVRAKEHVGALLPTACFRRSASRFPLIRYLRSAAALLILAAAWPTDVAATQYTYDDLGRLVQAHSSDGSVIQYQYDDNGNIVAINRLDASTLAIADISPLIGHVGASVTISGTGFSPLPGENTVSFGSLSATVNSASTTHLTVTVPEDAVTGPISVTVNGVSATSAASFVVRRPTVTSFSPVAVNVGGQVTLHGTNLNLVPGSTSIAVGDVSVAIGSLTNSQATFSAPAGGSGIIRVLTPYGTASSATSLIIAPPAIGAGSIVSTASLSPVGAGQSVAVGQANEYGVFTFTAAADEYLSVQISSLVAQSSVTYTLYSPTNVVLASGSVSSSRKSIHLPKTATAGTYLLAFHSGSGSFELTANLELDVELSSVGASVPFTTSAASQTKRVLFSAETGESLGLAITNLTLTPISGYAGFAVKRPNGNSLASVGCYPSRSPGCQIDLHDLPDSGTYTITADPSSSVTMDFTLTLSQSLSATLQLDIPQSVNLGVPGQLALLSFTVSEAQTVALNAGAVVTTPGSKAVRLQVFDSGGTQIASSNGTGNRILNLTNLAAGTYSVLINTSDAATATMQVTLASGLTGSLPVDGTSASFSTTVRGQQGYFTFEATAGDSLGLAITNLALTPSSGYAEFRVKRPNGSSLAGVGCYPSRSPGCQINLHDLPDSGTYTVTADPSSSVAMDFTLTLSQSLSGTLQLDTPQSVNLGVPGQLALLTFTASADQTMVLNASVVVTTPGNKAVSLKVFDSGGTQIASSNGSGNRTLNLSNLAAGTYSVLINTTDAATATMQVTLQ